MNALQKLADFDPNTLADLHERRQPLPCLGKLKQVAAIIADDGQTMPTGKELNQRKLPTPELPAQRGRPTLNARSWLENEFPICHARVCPIPDKPGLSIFAT